MSTGLKDMVEKFQIPKKSLFTMGRLHNKDGLIFFELNPVENEDGEVDYHDLQPTMIIIDGEKFTYSDTMIPDLFIHSINKVLSLNTLTGGVLEFKLNELIGFPFRTMDLVSNPPEKPNTDGLVKIEE